MKPVLSVVVPVGWEHKFEGEALATALAEVLAGVSHEVVLVDDGNPPDTARALEDAAAAHAGWRVLRLSRRFGMEAALTAGLDAARGEGVLVLAGATAAEWSHIPALLGAWREGGYDVVRLRREKEGRTTRLMHWLGVHVFQVPKAFPLPSQPLVFLADSQAVALVRALPERTRYVDGLFGWIGLRQTVIKCDVPPSKVPFLRAFGSLWQAALSFSLRPLDWITWPGLLLGMAGAVWLVVLWVLSLLGTAGLGIAALSALLLLLTGAILGCMGMLGAYLGRVYDEVRQRPMYILSHETAEKPEHFQDKT